MTRAVGEGVAAGWATSEWLADRVVRIVRTGRHMVGGQASVRARRLRRSNRHPLPNLWEVHPDARVAHARELGLRSVPLDEIAGTAVGGPAQRGADFLPLPRFRSANWRGRWQRIRRAVDGLEVLPPVDLVKYDGRYWVTDGHNRVAAALYSGQVEIDAVVTALVPQGAAFDEPPATLAEIAADSRAVRAAGSGHWTSGVSAGAIGDASAAIDRGQDRDRPADRPAVEGDSESAAARPGTGGGAPATPDDLADAPEAPEDLEAAPDGLGDAPVAPDSPAADA